MAERFYLGYVLGKTIDKEEPQYFLPKMISNKYTMRKNTPTHNTLLMTLVNKGFIYAATNSDKIVKYDNEFNIIAESNDLNSKITDMDCDDGYIFISTRDNALIKFDMNTLTQVAQSSGMTTSSSSGLTVNNDYVYVVSGINAYKVNKDTLSIEYSNDIYAGQGTGQVKMITDADGYLYTGRAGSNIFYKLNKNDLSIAASINNFKVEDMVFHSLEESIIVRRDDNLVIIDKGTLESKYNFTSNSFSSSLNSKKILINEKVIYVPSNRNTIIALSEESLGFLGESNDLFYNNIVLLDIRNYETIALQNNRSSFLLFETLYDKIGYERIDVR